MEAGIGRQSIQKTTISNGCFSVRDKRIVLIAILISNKKKICEEIQRGSSP